MYYALIINIQPIAYKIHTSMTHLTEFICSVWFPGSDI